MPVACGECPFYRGINEWKGWCQKKGVLVWGIVRNCSYYQESQG